MITTEGAIYIKRYLAGMVPTMARSIAFGIGNTGEIAGSTKLQFEAGRSDIKVVSYNFSADKLVFKAAVDESFGGSIYELGLYSSPSNEVAGEFGSKVLTTFDSDLEEWADATSGVLATFTTTGVRLGADGLIQTPAVSTSKTDAMTSLFLDFSGYSNADKFVFAFAVNNANAADVKFRFLTDASNYYEFSLGAQTTGYKITEVAKSTATVTGSPDWGNITEIRVTTQANGTGGASVTFDGIRIDDADSFNQDYILISREVLSVPYVKQAGMTQEVEFTLDVSIT